VVLNTITPGHSTAAGHRTNCSVNCIFSPATLFSKMKMSGWKNYWFVLHNGLAGSHLVWTSSYLKMSGMPCYPITRSHSTTTSSNFSLLNVVTKIIAADENLRLGLGGIKMTHFPWLPIAETSHGQHKSYFEKVEFVRCTPLH
jgi:hypothetical protein